MDDRSAGRSRPEQVPSVASGVNEDYDASAWLVPRIGDELHAGRAHPLKGLLEVVHAQKQPIAPSELVPAAPD